MEAHGAPRAFYVDNGSPYVSRQLLHALAVLGIQITHSRPRRPQGKGKIERLFETVRAQFLVEVAGEGGQAGTTLGSVTELEELFGAWVHQVYHQAVHGETGQAPAVRFAAAPSRLRQIAPQVIDEAFLWQDFRTVTKTATISLHGNRYQVDPALAGRKVEVLYNPADLTTGIRVRWRGTDMGEAVPHVIGRHSHPGLAPAAPAPAAPTGIDYLRMVAEAHRAAAGRLDQLRRPRRRPARRPQTARTTAGRGSPGDPPPGPAPAPPAELAALLADGADGAARRHGRHPAAHRPSLLADQDRLHHAVHPRRAQPAQRPAAGARPLEGRRPRPGRRAAALHRQRSRDLADRGRPGRRCRSGSATRSPGWTTPT